MNFFRALAAFNAATVGLLSLIVPITFSSTVAVANPSTVDRYLDFDGSDDVATKTGGFGVNANDYTFETWVYFEGQSDGDYGIFRYGDSPAQRLFLRVVRDQGVNTLEFGEESGHTLIPEYELSNDEWTHIAVVRESSTTLRVDVNAQTVWSSTAQSANSFDAGGLRIGDEDSSGNHWDGRIDQFKVWDGALSSADLAKSMHTWANSGISSASLIAHYDFNTASSTTLEDVADSYDLSWTGSPATSAFEDVKTTSSVGTEKVVVFPRSYLTAGGGWAIPDGVSSGTVLLVGGGGGGGVRHGGGGGGGALVYETDYSLTGTVGIQVGSGGRGGTPSEKDGSSGQDSRLFSDSGGLTAAGGGAGSSNSGTAGVGGSGGGSASGSANAGSSTKNSPSQTALDGTSVTAELSGNSGGTGGTDDTSLDCWAGGGGGGAASAGSNAATSSTDDQCFVGGAGGDGKAYSITGSEVLYGAGGGGAGGAHGAAGPGGSGGGGNGGSPLTWTLFDYGSSEAPSGANIVSGFPENFAGMNLFFEGIRSVTPLTGAVDDIDETNLTSFPSSANELSWSRYTNLRTTIGQNDPDDDYFAYLVTGTFTPSETGEYTFDVASDDAGDVVLGNQADNVVSHYGGHAAGGIGVDTGVQELVAGRAYPFVARMQEKSGGEGLHVLWKRPSDSDDTLWRQSSNEFSDGTGSDGLSGRGAGGGGGGFFGATNFAAGDGGSGAVIVRHSVVRTVTFHPGEAGGSSSTQTVQSDVSTNLTANSFSKPGYTFVGWNTALNGSGTPYSDGESVTLSSDITLYAQWSGSEGRPSAPVDVSTNPSGNTLTVSWGPPDNLSSKTITGYRVEYADADRTGWSIAGVEPWVLGTDSAAASDRSYTITGLTVGESYYVRVAALYSGGQGAYGYPWTANPILETQTPNRVSDEIQYQTGFGVDGTGNPERTVTDFSRIRYRLEASYGGTDNYVDANFDRDLGTKTSASSDFSNLNKLQVPSLAPDNAKFEIQADVRDLTVESNVSAVEEGYGLSGRIEFWPYNYSRGAPPELSGGDDETYDFSDTPADSGDYGSFQLHRLDSVNETIFAWNRHRETSASNVEIGFGPGPVSGGGASEPDWTFCGTTAGSGDCAGRSNFKLQIFVNQPTELPTTQTITFSANGSGVQGTMVNQTGSYNATVSLTKSTFTRNGYHFAGWNTASDGSGTSYADEANISLSGNIDLYAVWERAEYTFTFDNNHDGSTTTQNYYSEDPTVTLPSPSRDGYRLSGWFTQSTGGSLIGAAGASYSTLETNGLILRYELDHPDAFTSGARTEVTDVSGAGSTESDKVNADVSGATFSTADGMGLDFNGDYLLTDSLGPRVGTTDEISVFAWVYPRGNGVVVTELGQKELPGSNWHDSQIEVVGEKFRFGVWNYSGRQGDLPTSATVTYNRWYYVGLTYDGTTLTGYVNGESVGSLPWTRSTPAEDERPGLHYGIGPADSTNLGDGSAGNFRLGSFHVYKTGLSAASVSENFKATCARFANSDSGIVGTCTERTAYAQWELDTYQASADTFVNSGASANTSFGSSPSLVLKNDGDSVLNSFNRISYTRFDLDPSISWNGAALDLTVISNNSGGGSAWNSSYTTFNVNVYGVDDVGWSDTLTFNQANASTSAWGIDTSVWPWAPNSADFLGTISIPTSESTVGNTYSLATTELDQFLNDDADGEVTLILVRSDTDNRGDLGFASSENTTYDGPTIRPTQAGDSYTIAYDINGGSGSLPAPGTFTNGGASYTVAAASSIVAPAHKNFLNWNTKSDGSGTPYSPGDSYNQSRSVTLYAQFQYDTYTVTFNKGTASGASGSNNTLTKTHATNLTLPSSATANGWFTKLGYTVTGWSTSADGSTSDFALNASYAVEGNATLYPVWTPDTYTVTYTYNGADGGNTATTASYTVDGIALSLPRPTKTGYSFAGWYSDSGLTTSVGDGGDTYRPTQATTLYAKWDAQTFTILFDYRGATGGNGVSSDTYTTELTAITLPTPTREGYTFSNWYEDSALTTLAGGAGASYEPTANRTIYAKWTAIGRSVTYNTGSASGVTGSVPIDSTTYYIGESVVVKANTGPLEKSGYRFAGWVTNADGTGSPYAAGAAIVVATANINLYPQWEAKTYTVTYHPNGASGTLSKTSDSWTVGDSDLTLPTTVSVTKPGHTFNDWGTTPSAKNLGATYQPEGDVTLYAQWSVNDISYQFSEGVDGSGQSLSTFNFTTFPTDDIDPYGTTITLPSVDTEIDIDGGGVDYQFGGWSDGNSVYNTGDTYLLGETDVTFTAQWVKVYSVRYVLAGGELYGADKVTDDECAGTDNTCTDGQEITLNRTPTRAGYTFGGWQNQAGTTIAARLKTNVSDTNFIFTAQWAPIDYLVSFNEDGGSVSTTNSFLNVGDAITIPSAGSKTGYTFSGWRDESGVLYAQGDSVVMGAGAKSFNAVWIPDVYTVSYEWQGGSSSTPKVSDSYTVGTGPLSLPTASAEGYSRDGFIFSGWSESAGGSAVTNFAPTSDDVLYAVWADGNYTVTFDAEGGSGIGASASVARTNSTTLPEPARSNFTFTGWYTAASGGEKVGNAGDSYTPSRSSTLYARWVQDSLYGVDFASLDDAIPFTASDSVSINTLIEHTPSNSSARVQIPAGALPAGTNVTVRYFKDTERQSDLIAGDNNYFFAVLVSWLLGSGDTATVPNTADGKPILVTLTNSDIKAGAMVYQVIGENVTELGRATQNGTVTVELTEDPELVVAATKPDAPTSISGTAGDTSATVSWTPGASGGTDITGYTVTASPGGASCTTAQTSCTIESLTNNTAYTFSVTATNAIGTSNASSASGAVTPVGANYDVTFDSNGGSAVATGSFFSGSTVSAPSSPSRSGFTFDGWSTTADDATTIVTFPYAPGVTEAITLYAVWTPVPVTETSRSNSRQVPLVIPSTPIITPLRGLPAPPPRLGTLPAPFVLDSPVNTPGTRGSGTVPSGPVSRIGGIPSPTETRQVDGGLDIRAGGVNFGLKTEDRADGDPGPQLRAPSGTSAQVSGSGLAPGSTVQVWLPGVLERELGRITVDEDGGFDGAVALSSRASEGPLPIGTRVLQLTGVDANGMAVVVDVPVKISQGPPVPEPLRESGALPDVGPGESIATSAGLPTEVIVTPIEPQRSVTVDGGDWAVNVVLNDPSGEVTGSQNDAQIRLSQSSSAVASGDGFQPGTIVSVWFFSDPTLVGTASVGDDGGFVLDFTVDPQFIPAGDHTLQIQGVGEDGYIKSANLGVVVTQPTVLEPSNQIDAKMWVTITVALGALLAAALLLMYLRRRRTSTAD